jgi:hypothetical protein
MPMSVRELDETYRRTYRRLIAGVLIVYAAGFLLVFTLLISNPRIASWVTEAMQAELAITTQPAEPQPTRVARPAQSMQSVRND